MRNSEKDKPATLPESAIKNRTMWNNVNGLTP